MATSMTPPSGGGSMFDQVGAALADTSEASQPDVQTSPETTETEPEVTTGTPEGDTSVEGAVATAPPVPEVEENPYEQPEEGEVPQQTLDTILKTPRGKEIYASHKTLREFAKPMDQGGIGHIPTVEQIRDYFGAFRDRRLMDHDLDSGSPEQATHFLDHIFGPQADGRPRESAGVVAAQIAPALAKANPEAYAMAAEPFISNYSTRLWDRWAEAKTPELKEALYQAAQLVHRDLTGKYRTEAEFGARGVTAQPQGDPLAEERAQLAAERARVEQTEQRQSAESQRYWTTQTNALISQSLSPELDRALAPLKAMLKDSPKRYERRMKEFHDEVVAAVPQANPHLWDLYKAAYKDAQRTGNAQQQQSVAKEYTRLATPVIRAKFRQFLTEEGVAVTASNGARHAELRQIDSHRAPSNGGAPLAPSQGAPIQRLPGETTADFNLRFLRS